MKLDMHCHTKAGSIDARITIERYIELLQRQNFDGMLITDHDSYKGYEDWLKKRSSLPSDFVVLKGIEYDTKDAGHFLVIMPDDVHLPVLRIRGMSIAKLEQLVHYYGGILGPAHPFGARSSSAMFCRTIRKNPSLISKFDFFEGFNCCEKKVDNKLAQLLAEKYGKPCIGGSDAHKETYVGMAYTLFQDNIYCNNDLIATIKGQRIADFGGKERPYLKKHKKRYSFAATWGFKTYNRSLGLLFSPYRYYKIRKLSLHQG